MHSVWFRSLGVLGSVAHSGGSLWTGDLTCALVWGARSLSSSEPQRQRKPEEGASPSQAHGGVRSCLDTELGDSSEEGKDVGRWALKLLGPCVFQGSRQGFPGT